MVALLDKSPLTSQTALRARGATSRLESRRAIALKYRNRIELGRSTYDARRRLGSCSKEPIGYVDAWNLYGYVANNPTEVIDPYGWWGLTPLPRKTDMKGYQIFDCSQSIERAVVGQCWLDCLVCGTVSAPDVGPIYQEGIEFGGERYPPTEDDPNPIKNQALRHCFSSAVMSCTVGSRCAQCAMNARERYQNYCGGQTLRDGSRAQNNNNIGIAISKVTCDKAAIKDKCLAYLGAGILDTRPDLPDTMPRPRPTAPTTSIVD